MATTTSATVIAGLPTGRAVETLWAPSRSRAHRREGAPKVLGAAYLDELDAELEYPGHYIPKRVTNAGTIRFKKRLLFWRA